MVFFCVMVLDYPILVQTSVSIKHDVPYCCLAIVQHVGTVKELEPEIQVVFSSWSLMIRVRKLVVGGHPHMTKARLGSEAMGTSPDLSAEVR